MRVMRCHMRFAADDLHRLLSQMRDHVSRDGLHDELMQRRPIEIHDAGGVGGGGCKVGARRVGMDSHGTLQDAGEEGSGRRESESQQTKKKASKTQDIERRGIV